MNRFFSKLDLRDIKIDPAGTSFPADAAEQEDEPARYLSPEPAPAPAPPAAVASARVAIREDALEVDDPHEGEAMRAEGVLKVSARSRPSAVAGAIAGVVRESGRAEVQAIGAGATNQAVKAVAIAREYLRETGIEAVCLPSFIDIAIDGEERTAILLVVETR